MATSETVDRTIRNHRYQWWPAVVAFLALGIGCLTIGMVLVSSLPHDLAMPVMAGTMIVFLATMSLVLRRIPQPVARVKLGVLLETFPGGMAYRPSRISDISFGPDPAEDYAESPLPVRLCQMSIAFQDGRRLQLIVGPGDATRLREWATEKGIAVSDLDGYSRPDGLFPSPEAKRRK